MSTHMDELFHKIGYFQDGHEFIAVWMSKAGPSTLEVDIVDGPMVSVGTFHA